MEEMHDLTKAIIQTVVADICKEFLINFLYMIAKMDVKSQCNETQIKDLIDLSDEDLKYLRDIASKEKINRYVLAEVTIIQKGGEKE